MSKGFLIYAENLAGLDYVQQAYALALSIKATQRGVNSVSLVTNEIDINEKYKKVFDHIIPTPWYDTPGTEFSAEHRWKMFHTSPYNETIVLDADMLLLEDISTWWDYCSNYDIQFCSRIKNYKLETVVDTHHRKTFIANNLSSPYFALHYFKRSQTALEFYKVLEFVCKNWEWCWTKFAPNEYQNWCSMDLATAVAIEIMMARDTVFDSLSPLEFIHMKTHLQGWTADTGSWQNPIHSVLNSKGDLVVGNIKQSKLFHYVESDFLTPEVIFRLEELANGKT